MAACSWWVVDFCIVWEYLTGDKGIEGVQMIEELRDQIIEADDELEFEEKSGLGRTLQKFRPWQRFVLAVLLFLNVAFCGLLGLVMLQRIPLPF